MIRILIADDHAIVRAGLPGPDSIPGPGAQAIPAAILQQLLPHTIAIGNIHSGIIAGKLNGVMIPATPIGRRKLIAHFFRDMPPRSW